MTNSVENFQSHFTEKTTYHISDNKLQNLLKQVYGKEIQMTESSNDTTHEFTVEANNSEYEWDKESVQEALEKGHMPCWQYYTILNDLCSKGHIKEGKYFIRVCW